jgi:hypothetical protein
VIEFSSHPNFSRGSGSAAVQNVRSDDAPMITGRGSPLTPSTAKFARIAPGNGGLRTPSIGDGAAKIIRSSANGTANGSESEIRSGGSAILPTTTQLLI